MMPGPTELIIILMIVVLVFGAKRIPEIMGGVGKGIRSFKKSIETDESPTEANSTRDNSSQTEKAETK
jgi:sec-independent protein translocase protein TatA